MTNSGKTVVTNTATPKITAKLIGKTPISLCFDCKKECKAGNRMTEMIRKNATTAIAAALFMGLIFMGPKAFSAELLMIEEDGCFWCEAWNKDVSEIYPKTLEGKSAPLRRVDIDTDLEKELELKSAVHFTPTFLLIENGKEISRIEGYPGEDFFWGILGQMLKELPVKEVEVPILNTSG